jgi:preprotein translocase subunit SecD
MAEAFRALGLSVPSGSTETEQLELLLDETNRRIVALYGPTEITGKQLTSAGRQQEQTGTAWSVSLGFNREGGEKFAALTQSLAGTGRVLGIVLDGRSISEATVGRNSRRRASPAGRPASPATSRPMRPVIWRFSCGADPFPCR